LALPNPWVFLCFFIFQDFSKYKADHPGATRHRKLKPPQAFTKSVKTQKTNSQESDFNV